MPLFRFLQVWTDGFQEDQLCDGTSHYTHLQAVFEGEVEHASRFGACDGSCRSEARTCDLRQRVERRSLGLLFIGGKSLDVAVEYDAAATELFAGDAPVLAVKFERWYAKRDGEGYAACTGATHVRVSVSHDNLAGRPTGRYETISVSVTPCDGSCQPVELPSSLLTATSEQE